MDMGAELEAHQGWRRCPEIPDGPENKRPTGGVQPENWIKYVYKCRILLLALKKGDSRVTQSDDGLQ
jgi:hypothetical protein